MTTNVMVASAVLGEATEFGFQLLEPALEQAHVLEQLQRLLTLEVRLLAGLQHGNRPTEILEVPRLHVSQDSERVFGTKC